MQPFLSLFWIKFFSLFRLLLRYQKTYFVIGIMPFAAKIYYFMTILAIIVISFRDLPFDTVFLVKKLR